MGESWDSSRTVPRSYLATLLPVFMILYFLGCHEHAGIKNRDVFLLSRVYDELTARPPAAVSIVLWANECLARHNSIIELRIQPFHLVQ